jgi:urease accessory protein
MSSLTRVTEILRAGHWAPQTANDFLCLTYDERHRRRFRYITAGGTTFLLDLPRATVLRAGDGLRLDDGRIVRVDTAPEALIEVTGADAATLVRLAWHIGNRHLPAQLEAHRIVIRDDHVIVGMLLGLGAVVMTFQGGFTPEPGAYDESPGPLGPLAHGHRHGHGNSHDQAHGGPPDGHDPDHAHGRKK